MFPLEFAFASGVLLWRRVLSHDFLWVTVITVGLASAPGSLAPQFVSVDSLVGPLKIPILKETPRRFE